MSTYSGSASNIAQTPTDTTPDGGKAIDLFSHRMVGLWSVAMLISVLSGILPIGPMPLFVFAAYYLGKVASLFFLGFLSPLSFRSLNGIGLSLSISLLSAGLIEILGGWLENSHSFHWYEMAGKLLLITIGFSLALDFRYQQKLKLGPLQLTFSSDKY